MVSVTQSGGAGGRGSFRFAWRGAEVQNYLEEAEQEALLATALAMKEHAQALAPVDTGLLRDSITGTTDARGADSRRTATLEAAAPYAAFVELGTSRQPAQPFLRPAIDAEAPRLTERLRAAAKARGL